MGAVLKAAAPAHVPSTVADRTQRYNQHGGRTGWVRKTGDRDRVSVTAGASVVRSGYTSSKGLSELYDLHVSKCKRKI